ncbi:MAG: hypothetical protein M0T70_08090 [Geobacteraceae bacterium]|nr:hypothetical protein [Geobacteraceae bacterium]
MRLHNCLLLLIGLTLTACAGNRPVSDTGAPTEYVEISNPGYTMSPGAPATIWVPKNSVDNGLPRGSEVAKMAYQSVKGGLTADAAPQQPSPAAGESAAGAVAPRRVFTGLRNRVAVLDTSSQQLAIPFQDSLRAQPGSPVLSVAPEVAPENIHSREERSAYAGKAWQESGVNLTLFVSAPEGITPGRYLSAEIYDGMGAGLVGKIDVVIPADGAKGPAGADTAVSSALALLVEKVQNAIALLPWYARIVAVEDGKVYLNAGHEAGINLGQKLYVYRGGKVVQGLGFAPGTRAGTLEVNGFIGSNGATATAKDGVQVYPTDIIAVQ